MIHNISKNFTVPFYPRNMTSVGRIKFLNDLFYPIYFLDLDGIRDETS